MSEPFVAEIRLFAGNFAPRDWAFCDGELMPIRQNTALYSLLGNTYGGDGRNTFALPNMQGRAPMQWGQGPGLTNRRLGDRGGARDVTLLEPEMPVHTHAAQGLDGNPNKPTPVGNVWAGGGRSPVNPFGPGSSAAMSHQAIGVAGSNKAHNNMQPYLGLNFIIALYGVFPSRS